MANSLRRMNDSVGDEDTNSNARRAGVGLLGGAQACVCCAAGNRPECVKADYVWGTEETREWSDRLWPSLHGTRQSAHVTTKPHCRSLGGERSDGASVQQSKSCSAWQQQAKQHGCSDKKIPQVSGLVVHPLQVPKHPLHASNEILTPRFT